MLHLCKFASHFGLYKCQDEVSARLQQEFIAYLSETGKSYATYEEYEMRMKLFQERHAYIEKINAEQSSFQLAHNEFSDMTEFEISKLYGYSPSAEKDIAKLVKLDDSNIPESVDWREHGAVNKIQDQKKCGACWAFSATTAVESQHYLSEGTLFKLSEQQLLDCGEQHQCKDGSPSASFDYLTRAMQEFESDYPYSARPATCRYQSNKGRVGVTDVSQVEANDTDQIKAAVANGPIVANVKADSLIFVLYSFGIIDSKLCGTTPLNHSINIVGYGKNIFGKEYYIVRNSWGPLWGEFGYARIAIE